VRDFDDIKWKTWQHARAVRQDRSVAERLLWFKLRSEQLGAKFRRQHPIGHYIVDFFCIERRLVIEIDGPTHAGAEQQDYDARRTEYLNALGYRVLRFTNGQVREAMEHVLERIREALKEP